jgi:hypothetical protein
MDASVFRAPPRPSRVWQQCVGWSAGIFLIERVDAVTTKRLLQALIVTMNAA